MRHDLTGEGVNDVTRLGKVDGVAEDEQRRCRKQLTDELGLPALLHRLDLDLALGGGHGRPEVGDPRDHL